jgi:hypothetical protein
MATFGGSNIVTDGLVLWLDAANRKSYPGSGTNWLDLSGNNNTGTLTNGPTFSSANNGSIVFDGTNDYVTGSDSSNFAFGTGNFAVSTWFRTTANSVGLLVDLRSNTSGTGAGYSDYFVSGKYSLFYSNAVKYTSTGSISNNIWYNTVTTKISNTVYVYINGILDGSFSDSTNFNEGGFRLARNVNTTGTAYLTGNISQVMIYKGAGLSQSQIQQNYDALKSRYLNIY